MKKSKNDSFAEVKIKMVMNIYGVSRSMALELIAGRSASGVSNGDAGRANAEKASRHRSHVDDEMMSAAEFFMD